LIVAVATPILLRSPWASTVTMITPIDPVTVVGCATMRSAARET
jgi:hypothetical protein